MSFVWFAVFALSIFAIFWGKILIFYHWKNRNLGTYLDYQRHLSEQRVEQWNHEWETAFSPYGV